MVETATRLPQFQRNKLVGVSLEGRISTVVGVEEVGGEEVLELRDRAMLPGFVNAHSHAFHRGLRARGEARAATSFWSWRDGMYALAAELAAQPSRFYQVAYFDLTMSGFRERAEKES